jgi:hypothetical protein
MLYKEYVKEIWNLIDQLKLATEKDSFLYSGTKAQTNTLISFQIIRTAKAELMKLKIKTGVGTASGMTEVQDELYQLVQ